MRPRAHFAQSITQKNKQAGPHERMTAFNACLHARHRTQFFICLNDVFGDHIAQIIVFNDAATRLDDGGNRFSKALSAIAARMVSHAFFVSRMSIGIKASSENIPPHSDSRHKTAGCNRETHRRVSPSSDAGQYGFPPQGDI